MPQQKVALGIWYYNVVIGGSVSVIRVGVCRVFVSVGLIRNSNGLEWA